MTRQDLTSEISFLSVLLKNEFIYGVEGLEKNVHNTLESMEKDGVIGSSFPCFLPPFEK